MGSGNVFFSGVLGVSVCSSGSWRDDIGKKTMAGCVLEGGICVFI